LGGHKGDCSFGGGLNDLATLDLGEREGFFQKNGFALLNGF